MNQNLKYKISEDQNIKVGDYVEYYNLLSKHPKKVLLRVVQLYDNGFFRADDKDLVLRKRRLEYATKVILIETNTDGEPLLHKCFAPSDLEMGGYGIAIEVCWEEENNKLWVGNTEYANVVNFCPFCGFSCD